MTKREYEKLNANNAEIITADMLENKANRTLVYGCTFERHSYHVYILDGVIHTVTYTYDGPVIEINVIDNVQYRPNKRAYPETCDYEFCTLLRNHGVELSFTTWDDDRIEEDYYGEIL